MDDNARRARLPSPPGPRGLWYGWVVLGVGVLSMLTAIALRNTFAVFYVAILAEFGWRRAETAGAFSLGLLAQGACSPLAGVLLDRYGARRTISFGLLLTGLTMLSGFLIQARWHLYALNVVLSGAFAAVSFLPHTALVGRWFYRRRGLAMGLVMTAQGFGNAAQAGVQFFIQALGWRGAYVVLGLATIFCIAPLTYLLQRSSPEEAGTTPDGLPAEAPGPPGLQYPLPSPWGPRRALRFPRFWLLGVLYATQGFCFSILIVHLVAHLVDVGLSPLRASFYFAAWGFSLTGGNLASALSDRLGRTLTYFVGVSLAAGGTYLLAGLGRGSAGDLILASVALAGVGLGLIRPTASALLADHFLGPHFGALNGLIMVFFGTGAFFGPWMAGLIYDWGGSYRPAYLGATAVLLGSALFAWLLRRAGLRARVAPGP